MKISAIILAVLLSCFSAEAATVTPTPVYNFLQTLGVGVHLGGSGGFYDPSNFSVVESSLQYLGVSFVRDNLYTVSYFPYFLKFNSDIGIKYDFIVSPGMVNQYQYTLPFIQVNPNIIQEIEGPNEVDNTPISWNSLSGLAAARAFQYQLLKDISPMSIQLDTLTDTTYSDQATLGSLPASYYNFHEYLQGSVAGGGGYYTQYPDIQYQIIHMQALSPGRPSTVTENGAWTQPCTTGYTQNVQAKSMLMSMFDAFILGTKHWAWYELGDQINDPTCITIENHFGVFNNDGTAKVAATTWHNLYILLADSKILVPTSLSYTLSGMPAGGYSLLLQKSDGTFWLAVWNDAQIWNFSTYTEIAVAPVSVTLNLGVTATTINVYDPYIGTSVQQTASNASSIVLSVPDHVILVNIRP